MSIEEAKKYLRSMKDAIAEEEKRLQLVRDAIYALEEQVMDAEDLLLIGRA